MPTFRNFTFRIALPLLAISGYVELVCTGLHSKMQMFWSGIIGLPLLIIGLGLLCLPAYIRFDDHGSKAVIFRFLRRTIVAYDEIECIKKSVAGFAIMNLKSGQKYFFILEDRESYLLSTFSCLK
jgi:hypothetical protein